MWRLIVGTTCVVVPVTITALDVVGYVAKVEGASMQPCLNPEKKLTDYVLLNRWKVRNFDFERGEVVSLACPVNSNQKIIKRIVGLEGDTIKTLTYKNRYVRVPEGHCWIEGDHHSHSMDSNYFGPVALGLINAKASHIVWPPSRWQRINKRFPHERVNSRPKPVPEHILNVLDEMDELHVQTSDS